MLSIHKAVCRLYFSGIGFDYRSESNLIISRLSSIDIAGLRVFIATFHTCTASERNLLDKKKALVHCTNLSTVITRVNATAYIKFLVPRMRRLFEGAFIRGRRLLQTL